MGIGWWVSYMGGIWSRSLRSVWSAAKKARKISRGNLRYHAHTSSQALSHTHTQRRQLYSSFHRWSGGAKTFWCRGFSISFYSNVTSRFDHFLVFWMFQIVSLIQVLIFCDPFSTYFSPSEPPQSLSFLHAWSKQSAAPQRYFPLLVDCIRCCCFCMRLSFQGWTMFTAQQSLRSAFTFWLIQSLKQDSGAATHKQKQLW